ncbi:MAG TPA: hypothetical protein VKM55_28365 [Candidatus Lokiarchaeia archaeon]|nr:hypothetical protein [Candidatus Lokiarchaeia archaeon]
MYRLRVVIDIKGLKTASTTEFLTDSMNAWVVLVVFDLECGI